MQRIALLLSLIVVPYSLLFAQKPIFRKPADYWAEIPAGTLNRHGEKTEITSFYMQKTEVSNAQYLEFLHYLKQNGTPEEYALALPDTTVWKNALGFNEAYVIYYLRHPAYRHYPVVGITYEAAMLYCRWMEETINRNITLFFPKLKGNKVQMRLPTETDWMWAAQGGIGGAYPWGGPYIRNHKGEILCNVYIVGEECVTLNPQTGIPQLWTHCLYAGKAPDNLTRERNITAPVKSYWPNMYNLYNMSGNVAEMVMEKGRTKGGSWFTCGGDANIFAPDPFDGDTSPKSFVGFRPAAYIVK